MPLTRGCAPSSARRVLFLLQACYVEHINLIVPMKHPYRESPQAPRPKENIQRIISLDPNLRVGDTVHELGSFRLWEYLRGHSVKNFVSAAYRITLELNGVRFEPSNVQYPSYRIHDPGFVWHNVQEDLERMDDAAPTYIAINEFGKVMSMRR